MGRDLGADGDHRHATWRGARAEVDRHRSRRRNRHHPLDEDSLRRHGCDIHTEDGPRESHDRHRPATVAALKGWKRVQSEDRMRTGPAWQGIGGLVVTVGDGSAPNPEAFSHLFHKLLLAAGLPRIRLHDLRHSYATAALAAGVPVKVLSQRIGHADVGVTLKVYAHVLPGDDEDAAIRADALLADL